MTPSQIVELRYYARRILSERQEVEGKCGSNAAYGTRAQAVRTIRRDAKRAGVVAYRCQLGDHWHVGAWRLR